MSCKESFSFEQMLSLYWWKIKFFEVTGGRPMIDLGHNFTDKVTGKSVRNYQDRLGRYWMADSGPWRFFRVEKEQ